MRGLLGLVMLLLSSCAHSHAPEAAGATAALPRLGHVRQWLIDEQERVVMLRGANVYALDASEGSLGAGARRAQLWRAETPRKMAEAGFDAVRLVLHLSDVMPSPGRIDEEHLETIARTVAAYRDAGLYTLLDFHQDEYGPSVGVRGLPGWATFTDGHVRNREVSFPNGYFREPAVQRAFDNFWANHPVPGTDQGVQDLYVAGLVAVARRFASEPAVLGIDVMNEPATGTPCSQPDPEAANCPELEEKLLRPFYAKAGAALRAAAPDTLILVEPFMLQGALGIPIRTPPPGTPGRQGLSYHNYGPIPSFRNKTNDSALAWAIETDSALLNTEWGFTSDAAELSRQARDFDDRLISWLAWARGPFEALVNPDVADGDVENAPAVLRAYARPYPSATAGTPTRLRFDPDAGVLEYSYATVSPRGRRLEPDALTEIRVPAINFPSGYRASVQGGRIASKPNAARLLVRAHAGAATVDVRVERIGALPALLAPPTRPSTYSILGDLLRDPETRAIVERHVPQALRSPWLGLAPQTSLRGMQAHDTSLTDALLDAIDRELAQRNAAPAADGA